VIGADGFGFAPHAGTWEKIEQLGAVRIGDDVEIGANTCIDRGALQDTVIEDGVKLDNLIQIGHNVRIGATRPWPAAWALRAAPPLARIARGRWRHRAGAPDAGRRRPYFGRHGGDALHPQARAVHRRVSHRRQCALGKKRRHPQAAAQLRERIKALEKTNTMMDIHQILKQLPHRYPFLLVDRVLELEKGKRIKALKNVTINEPFFTGPLSAPAGDAGRADARSHGPGCRACWRLTPWA
jgi:hypothetical protein